MAAKKKVFVTWFNINNIQMKVKLLWVGKETIWYLNYKPFPTRTESLWLNNAEKEKNTNDCNAAHTLSKPYNSFAFQNFIYFHRVCTVNIQISRSISKQLEKYGVKNPCRKLMELLKKNTEVKNKIKLHIR